MEKQLQMVSGNPVFSADIAELEFVTLRVAGQLFGTSVLSVQDVLRGIKLIPVPLAPKSVAGLFNLRGRIVIAINMCECLNIEETPEQPGKQGTMSVVVEYKNELISLMVDAVGEVITIAGDKIEKSPANISVRWREASSGIYKLDNELLVILDIPKLLKL